MPAETEPPDAPSALTAALDYARRGWRVLPIIPGQKRPPMGSWQEAATTDEDTIVAWFTGLYRNHGVGIATGRGSGVLALDVDLWESLKRLEATHGILPDTLTNLTGSGGMHMLYRYPTDGRVVRNSAGSKLGAGLDIRGEGGQVVVWPTVHPNGHTYEWDAGQPAEPVDAPEWFLDLICEQPEAPRAEPLRNLVDGERPGDAFDAVDWADILTADGWTLAHTDPRTGERHWTRPGKDAREGTSATTGYTANDNLKVFTSSMTHAGLDPEGVYTKLGYWAATRFGGDHSAAASDLRSNGYGRQDERIYDDPRSDARGDNDDADGDADDINAHGWEPVDLGPVLAGEWAPPTPTMLRRSDGVGLIYAGRVHSIAGEPGGGKTWIALVLAAEVMRSGERVLFIDYEDTPSGCVARLRALGVTDADITERFDYVQPQRPLVANGKLNVAALERLAAYDVALAIIDSVGESIASEGLRPNDDDDVVRWMQVLPRRLAHRNGAAVVALDHVAKQREGRGLWAIGSQRKLAAIDGAAYVLEVTVAPTRTVEGHMKLICAKDRHGTHQRGHQVALIDVVPDGPTTRITGNAPPSADEPFRPTVLMERVSRYLEQHGTSSRREVTSNVPGKDKVIGQAIDVLVVEDYVEQAPRKGRGGGWELSILRPFRDDSEGFEACG